MTKLWNILKGSLDLNPSPSVKIEIKSRKICLRCKCNKLQGIVNKLLEAKSLLTSPSNILPQVNFPANNLNFHWRWRWWDQIQAIFLNLFYFTWNNSGAAYGGDPQKVVKCWSILLTWVANPKSPTLTWIFWGMTILLFCAEFLLFPRNPFFDDLFELDR